MPNIDQDQEEGSKDIRQLLDKWVAVVREKKTLNQVSEIKDIGPSHPHQLKWTVVVREFDRVNLLAYETVKEIVQLRDPERDPTAAEKSLMDSINEFNAFVGDDFFRFLQGKYAEEFIKIQGERIYQEWLKEVDSLPVLDTTTLKTFLYSIDEQISHESRFKETRIMFVAAALSVLDLSHRHGLIAGEEVVTFFDDEKLIKMVGEHLVLLYGEKYPNFHNSATFKPDMDYLLRDSLTSHLHSCLSILTKPIQGKIIYRSIQSAFEDTVPKNEAVWEGNLPFLQACQVFLDDSFLKDFEWKGSDPGGIVSDVASESEATSETIPPFPANVEVAYAQFAKVLTEIPPGTNQIELLTCVHFLNFLNTYNAHIIEVQNLVFSRSELKVFEEKYGVIMDGLKMHEVQNMLFSGGRLRTSKALIGFTPVEARSQRMESLQGVTDVPRFDELLKQIETGTDSSAWRKHEVVSVTLKQLKELRAELFKQGEKVKKNEWLQEIREDHSERLTSASSPAQTEENHSQPGDHAADSNEKGIIQLVGNQVQNVAGLGGQAVGTIFSTGAGVITSVAGNVAATRNFVIEGGIKRSAAAGAQAIFGKEPGSVSSTVGSVLQIPGKIAGKPYNLLKKTFVGDKHSS
ncbi:hypothetical protein PTTG_25965 [Puccinia triticina 1-1 BBBD Race 1]|uniref:Uncharacterized protein n=1 Tax=Puccinia triticina (isolate 1-1 / race 1 (BBBD)) TaxID=630390 RepID=A0A180GZJ5_PUCT1|nr:hypothetical protein PTTG_25965 [Puccinia triticina 1-1 BBBD Race 1]WAR59303.1 hypothetical protein PtB15_10B645 [Puccinia triticina]